MTTHPDDLARQALTHPTLCQSGGVFYADIPHPVGDGRLRVALHGISDYEQASKAISILAPAELSGWADTPMA